MNAMVLGYFFFRFCIETGTTAIQPVEQKEKRDTTGQIKKKKKKRNEYENGRRRKRRKTSMGIDIY